MKNIILISLLALFSCKKEDVEKPFLAATIEVTGTSSPRPNSYILYTKVTNVQVLKEIKYHAGTTIISVPLAATGEVNVGGNRTGYFSLTYNDGKITVTATKTY